MSEDRRMARTMTLIAGVIGAIAGLSLLGAVGADLGSAYLWAVPFALAVVGGAIATQRVPDDRAAAALLRFGALATVWFASSLALYLAYRDGGGVSTALDLGVQFLGLAMATALAEVIATYPTGTFGGRGPRLVMRALWGAAALAPLLALVGGAAPRPWIIEWAADEGNLALGAAADRPWPAELGAAYLEGALAVIPLIGVVMLALRLRRLTPAERVQVRWPLFAVVALVVTPLTDLAVGSELMPPLMGEAIDAVVVALIPIALTIGLIRPDLFDIEGVARRTAIYVALWITVGAAYLGVAAAFGIAAGGDNLQVAVAVAIATSLLLEPARRALAHRGARMAYGERVSGEELVRRLGSTLEHTLDRDALAAAIATTVREGFGARWARVSLVSGPDALAGARSPGSPPALSAALVHAGERIGAIECGASERGRVYGPERELIATLAAQAALGLRNASLAGELRERLGELDASRARLVRAEERARRRIERDIHDGSQQELAALIARIALARNQLGRGDGTRLATTLAEIEAEAAQALENLRDLAAGIHPSVLSDTGIAEAIESRAARMPIPVELELGPGLRGARYPDATEGAVFFLVSECLANVLKHADASSIRVHAESRDGDLVLEVADDGSGFVPRAGDLAGIADRVSALGGTLLIDSVPGSGTRVAAKLPGVAGVLA